MSVNIVNLDDYERKPLEPPKPPAIEKLFRIPKPDYDTDDDHAVNHLADYDDMVDYVKWRVANKAQSGIRSFEAATIGILESAVDHPDEAVEMSWSDAIDDALTELLRSEFGALVDEGPDARIYEFPADHTGSNQDIESAS